MGVEPTTGAWEATVLPLHYGRVKDLEPRRLTFHILAKDFILSSVFSDFSFFFCQAVFAALLILLWYLFIVETEY